MNSREKTSESLFAYPMSGVHGFTQERCGWCSVGRNGPCGAFGNSCVKRRLSILVYWPTRIPPTVVENVSSHL